MATRTRKWKWPSALNPYIPDIVAKYRSGGMPTSHIAAQYRVMDVYIREILKYAGVYVYKNPSVVRHFRKTLEDKKLDLVTRKCLHCLKPFQSHGKGNRICSPCKGLAEFCGVITEDDFRGGRIS